MVKAKIGFWSNRSHYLDKMTMRDLVVAYFQYYAIQAYLVAGALATWYAIVSMESLVRNLIAAASAVVLYPVAWYFIHRYILHGVWLAKSPLTASVWKRVHYDHHQDPNHLEVLFGALYTTFPTIALITAPVGYAIGGWSGAAAALAAGMFTTCFYEFCHCIQHLNYKPKNRMLKLMKQRHMEHHFHDEAGNYGITNFAIDKVLGTYYERPDRPHKSPTVFNLGYDAGMADRYPWVARLSGGVATDHPRHRAGS